jgi:hypothetical protein
MRQKLRPVGVSPLARLIRGLRADRNPLRRATDRLETAIVAGLVATFLIGAPAVAMISWHWASAAGLRAEQIIRYKVHATLLENAPGALYSPYWPVAMPALARWTAPNGSLRTGLVDADSGGRAGTMVTIWTDETGRPIGQAPRRGQVTTQAALAAVDAAIVLGIVLLVAGTLALRSVNRRKLAAWDAAWQVVGPQWTSRR